jgi:hypothetical protein
MTTIFDDMIFPKIGNMGDSFVTSAIVRHFSKMCNKIHVPVAAWQIPTLTTLFQDDPGIQVMAYSDNLSLDPFIKQNNLVKINSPPIYTQGNQKDGISAVLWDEQWYTFYDLPFSLRYSGFHLPRNLKSSENLYDRLYKDRPYVLVHKHIRNNEYVSIDLQSYRSQFDLKPLNNFDIIEIEPSVTPNILDWLDLIRNASEIHCIPSCIFCLVDGMVNQTKAKLFYHNIRRSTRMRVSNRWNRYLWIPVNYPDHIFW